MSKFNRILKGDKFGFIACDNFTKDVVLSASVFFLTHYHSDHYEGLWNEAEAKEIGKIFHENPEKILYCSDITKRIFESDRDKRCFIPEEQIVSQPIGRPFNIFGPKRDNDDFIVATVTFIPTGHILGAVMILFEHENECALFTGDFRVHPKDLPKIKAFHDFEGDVKDISHLYLDTTFCSVKFRNFPLRSEVSEFVSEIVTDWLSLNSSHKVHFALPYMFAYESLLIDVSKELKCKILVRAEVYEKYYKYIPDLDNAVVPSFDCSNETKCRIHACVSNGSYKSWIINSCEFCKGNKNEVLVIKPSAMYFSSDKEDYKTLFKKVASSDIVRVPYSTHCSLEEMQAFVKYINPREITTICDNNEDFKQNILSLIEKPISLEINKSDNLSSTPVVLNLSDYCSSDDDCGLDSPPL